MGRGWVGVDLGLWVGLGVGLEVGVEERGGVRTSVAGSVS